MPRTRHRKLHILITAGPTREYLDTVRFISNPSSGKMGYAIAAAAARRGHRVTLVSGPVELKPPSGVETFQVVAGAEMALAARRAFKSADAAVFCAAVCDYRPSTRVGRKLPKTKRRLTLELVPTEDIAASLGRTKGRRVTIAFALEDHDGRNKAEKKLRKKNADAILLNGLATIGAGDARFEFLKRGGEWEPWPRLSKAVVARRVVSAVEELVANRGGTDCK